MCSSDLVFILCGFEHCVANMFYFTAGQAWVLLKHTVMLQQVVGASLTGDIQALRLRLADEGYGLLGGD